MFQREPRMTRDELQTLAGDVLLTVAPDVDLVTLNPSMSFRDQFEFDSVDFLNFVLTLEKQLDIRIPEVECPRLSSMDGCLDYLMERLSADA